MTLPSDLPIIQAPMAGGPSTPALTAAVAEAGGYGFVAGGYLTSEALLEAIATTRSLTDAPFGVNLFVPSPPGDQIAVARYGTDLAEEAERLHVELGEPRWEDDAYDEKLALLESIRVHLVSFTFGCPTAETVEQLHRAGVQSAVTVTSITEAQLAVDVGVDFLAVQGTEAGGHQASFVDLSPNEATLIALLREIRELTDVPMIAAGGIMNGRDAELAIGAGAIAVQIGTAFLCATEAGTSAPYRAALLDGRYRNTVLTRAFSGRYARGLANRFAREHSDQAPQAYPEVHHLTRPLRSAATLLGDSDVPNLWAGTGWRQVSAEPAGIIVARVASELRHAE